MYCILFTAFICGGSTKEKKESSNFFCTIDKREFYGMNNPIGNLNKLFDSRVKALEENKLIKVQKGFIGRKTNTTYFITKSGEKLFALHLDALEKMIRLTK